MDVKKSHSILTDLTPINAFIAITTTIITVTAISFSPAAFSASYQLYELGTPIIGTAGVGQAAVAEDASTAYFNPAGMGLFQSTQFLLGSQLLIPYINFSKNIFATTISGDNGSNAGMLTPGMDVYLAYSATDNLKLGLSLTTPYGGVLNYTDGWVGRYIVQNVTFYTINLNPSVAYRFNQWLSAGVGVAEEYMNLQQSVALPTPFPLVDGQIKVNVADYAPGFNAGLMITPTQTTKIGLAYRSRITHNLHGNSTFLRIMATPNTHTRMIMPENLILSLAQNFNQFTLLGELGWANWAAMQNTILTIDGYTDVTPLNWRNTYRLGLAGQYHFTPCFLLQAGISYDSSPTNASQRLPDLPMDRQIRAGLGVMYQLIPQATLGASYEYINFGHANIDNVSSLGVIRGSYSRNYANTLQVSLNVQT